MNNPHRRWVWASGSVHNMRDLGGYACDGGVTRYGIVLRSDQLIGLTEDEKQMLIQRGLTDVIDLRSEGEQRQYPNDFLKAPGIRIHTIELDHNDDEFQFSPFDVSCMGEMYLLMADANAEHYARMLGVIAEAKGMTIVHCMAGKDRTGIVCALLLLLLGVDECDVVADYQISETHLNRHIMGSFMSDNPNLPRHLTSSEPGNMWMLIKHFDEKYGGAERYLKMNGMTDAQIEKLRARMVEGDR